VAGALAVLALLASCSTSPTGPYEQAVPATRRAAGAPQVMAGRDAWAAVSVATLWRTPGSVRPVDRPALQRPARIRAWLTDMTLAERRGLNGRADTQALLGEKVRVLRLRGEWARVVVPDQPSPRDARGYPGWVPTRQLTARPPSHSADVVTITSRTAWLRDDDTGRRVLEISFGTRLPYLGTVGRAVRVRTPLGVVRRVRAAAVSVRAPEDPALPRTRRNLVRTAQLFTGLPYLWAGVSGFGLDCSGLTWLDHRSHGMVIPRDAAPQSAHGKRVDPAHLRRGDLLFYATAGVVHHVAMYAGGGRVVQAPRTGGVVETVPAYWNGYAGARRYLR
jgi:cell wall-associated NlpC family hydrolase